MSHFYTIVILPEDVDEASESDIEALMERYSEHIEVAPYDRPCHCVSNAQYKMKNDAVENEAGMTWEQARKTFNEKFNAEHKNTKKEDAMKMFTLREKEWAIFTKKLRDADCKYNSKDFPAKPDKKCTECKGIGTYKSTYNPDSKWDYWTIGGRWNGEITGKYKGSKDGFNFGKEYEQLNPNTTRVKDLIKRKEIPFAIVTPDGTWNERGQMGWFGMTANEKCGDVWENITMSIYNQYPNNIAVGLDCHI